MCMCTHTHSPGKENVALFPIFLAPRCFLLRKKGKLIPVYILSNCQNHDREHSSLIPRLNRQQCISFLMQLQQSEAISSHLQTMFVSAKYSHSIMCFKAKQGMKVGICSSNVETLKYFTSIACDLCLKRDMKFSQEKSFARKLLLFGRSLLQTLKYNSQTS